METFTALDFETAQGYRWSICQIGLVRVVEGEVADSLSLLVQPPNNYYWRSFSDIHGIRWWDTQDSPTFDQVWPQISPYIEGQTVIAHNSAFDFGCLEQTLSHYGMEMPTFSGHCTYRIYRKGLGALCEEHGIPLNHHDALSDARACAALFLRYCINQVPASLTAIESTYGNV